MINETKTKLSSPLHTLGRELFKRREGWKNKVYTDDQGNWTIGCGHYIGKHLSQLRLSDNIISHLLDEDLEIAIAGATRVFGEDFSTWKIGRQLAVVSMVFQMGLGRFLGFKETIIFLRKEMWEEAAKEALDSDWGRRYRTRASEVAEMIRTGEVT